MYLQKSKQVGNVRFGNGEIRFEWKVAIAFVHILFRTLSQREPAFSRLTARVTRLYRYQSGYTCSPRDDNRDMDRGRRFRYRLYMDERGPFRNFASP